MNDKEALEVIKNSFNKDLKDGLLNLQVDWLIKQAEKVEQYEKSFTDYTDTLNQARRKRDSVKNKLSVALKTIKEQKQEIKRLEKQLEGALLTSDFEFVPEPLTPLKFNYFKKD